MMLLGLALAALGFALVVVDNVRLRRRLVARLDEVDALRARLAREASR